MTDLEIANLGVVDLVRAYVRGNLSPVEATERYLDRIDRHDPVLKAFVTLDADRALDAAKASEDRYRRGVSLGPLDGVPYAVKDNIAVAGLPCTSGVEGRRDQITDEDADCVEALRLDGAILLGTLNMHEGALGATTDNLAYGRCLNPHGIDAQLTPGGSSGGSGSAVAAGLCAFALGTDTMGSVRIPAAYCGVYGYKPTYGGVPTGGLSHLSWSLDHIGPLARSAEDILAVMMTLGDVAWHERSDLARVIALGPIQAARGNLAVAKTLAPLEPGVEAAFDAAITKINDEVEQVYPFESDLPDAGAFRRLGLLISEAEGSVVFAEELADKADAITPGFRKLLEYGRDQSAGRLAAAYAAVRSTREQVQASFQGDESWVDILITPTTPQVAFLQGEPAPPSQADFTCLANICDLAAISVPIPVESGPPVGLQLLAPPGAEAALLGFALTLERVFGRALVVLD